MEYLIIGILTGWVLSEIGEYRIRQNYKRQLKSADEHATFLLDVILDSQSHERQNPTTTSKLPHGNVSESLSKPEFQIAMLRELECFREMNMFDLSGEAGQLLASSIWDDYKIIER